jgi:hypothetical protein
VGEIFRSGIPVKSTNNLLFACLTYNPLLSMVLRSFELGIGMEADVSASFSRFFVAR